MELWRCACGCIGGLHGWKREVLVNCPRESGSSGFREYLRHLRAGLLATQSEAERQLWTALRLRRTSSQSMEEPFGIPAESGWRGVPGRSDRLTLRSHLDQLQPSRWILLSGNSDDGGACGRRAVL